MASRPASARPGTSTGRQKASAAVPGRPPTSLARPSTGAGRAPQGAMRNPPPATARGGGRLGTAMAPPRTAMTGRMGGAAGRIRSSTLALTERPVTQQGLQGVRPRTTRAGKREIMDRTYYMGLLRAKMTDLSGEITRMNQDINHYSKENQNFLLYEKKAETLAQEIKELQGELADYNMLIDKMTTNSDLREMEDEYHQLKAQNDVESKTLEQLFAERREKEEEMHQLEADLENEKATATRVMNSVDSRAREKYEKLKEQNDQLMEDLHMKQRELQEITAKRNELEEELAVSQIKQEAMTLHEKLVTLEAKRDRILKEIDDQGTPEQQRERLLEQVKQYNQDIHTMEKQTAEVKKEIEDIHTQMRELDQEFEDQQGEKNQKYKELRQKEQQMDEFLDTFDEAYTQDLDRVTRLEANIVRVLQFLSKNATSLDGAGVDLDQSMSRPSQDPKEEYQRLQAEIQRVEAMETKVNDELVQLRDKLGKMSDELAVYTNTDRLRAEAEEKKKNLSNEKDDLSSKAATVSSKAREMQAELEALRAKLNENEMHTQLTNLEKKLQHLEQNNFALKDVIDARNAETNPQPVKENVMQLVAEYNQLLIQSVSKTSGQTNQ